MSWFCKCKKQVKPIEPIHSETARELTQNAKDFAKMNFDNNHKVIVRNVFFELVAEAAKKQKTSFGLRKINFKIKYQIIDYSLAVNEIKIICSMYGYTYTDLNTQGLGLIENYKEPIISWDKK